MEKSRIEFRLAPSGPTAWILRRDQLEKTWISRRRMKSLRYTTEGLTFGGRSRLESDHAWKLRYNMGGTRSEWKTRFQKVAGIWDLGFVGRRVGRDLAAFGEVYALEMASMA